MSVISFCAAFTGSAEAVLLVADQDAYIKGPAGGRNAFGTINAGNLGVAGDFGAGYMHQTVLHFDLSGVTPPPGLPNATDGTLTFIQQFPFDFFDPHRVGLYQIDSGSAGWDELLVTWANLPSTAAGTTLLDSYDPTPITTTFTPVTMSVPGAVIDDWITNPNTNAGLMLMVTPEQTGSTELKVWLGSKDSTDHGVAHGPQLQFDFVPEPATIMLLGAAAALFLMRQPA